jgi:hypothetical protein
MSATGCYQPEAAVEIKSAESKEELHALQRRSLTFVVEE